MNNATRWARSEPTQRTDNYSVLMDLIMDGKLNHIKITGKYSAQDKGSAGIRADANESGRGQGDHVGQDVFLKLVSYSFNPLGLKVRMNITFVDKSSRKGLLETQTDLSERGFGTRQFILYDGLDSKRNVKTLEFCQNFKTWKDLDLSVQDPFPALPTDPEELREIERLFLENFAIGNILFPLKKKVASMKGSKKAKEGCKSDDGSTLSYTPGNKKMTTKLVDAETGKGIPWVDRNAPRILLLPPNQPIKIEETYPDWCGIQTRGALKGEMGLNTDYSLLPLYVIELDRLTKQYEKNAKVVRPYELGLIDRALKGKMERVVLGDTILEVVHNDSTEKDPDPRAKEMLESGAWKNVEIETTGKGKWTLTEKMQTA